MFYGTEESPLTGKEKEQAKFICGKCAVRVECLAHSFRTTENWGIWGGLDERERRLLLKQHRSVEKAIAAATKQGPS